MSKSKQAAAANGECVHGGGTSKSTGKHYPECFSCMMARRHAARIARGGLTKRERAIARYGLAVAPVSKPAPKPAPKPAVAPVDVAAQIAAIQQQIAALAGVVAKLATA